MAERIHPSAKPTAPPAPATAPAKPQQLYNPNRHPYRPNPVPRRRSRSGRGCFCCCYFWTTLILILLVLVAAIAACAAYLIYSPRRPTFSVTSVKISQFNLTTSSSDGTSHLSSSLNLTVSAKNPNKKQITYSYNQISIWVYSGDALIANGSLSSFVSSPSNVTILRSTLSSTSSLIDADYVANLKSNLKRKNGLPLKIEMDTDVGVKMGKFKTKKVGIRVICEGIKGILPKGKAVTMSATANAKCRVDLRFKIWKFTF